MRLNQKIYTVYGYITIIDKRYSPLSNKVVWIGLDEQGMEHEVDESMVLPAPQNAPTSDSVDLMAIGKAFNLKKGDKGDRGPTGPRGPQGFKGDKGDSIVGPKGDKGEKGEDGKDGKDGKTGKAGPRGFDGKPGKDGKDGKNGKDGKDGLPGRDGLNGTSGGGIKRIIDASDVKITDLSDNQSLTYDAATKKWVNETVSGGSGTVETIVAGNNIDVDATDPANPIVSVETLTLADVSDVTASTAEVNVLDGIPATLTATELGYMDGVTSSVQTQLGTKANSAGALTQFVGNTAHRVFYSDASGDVTELALGADGTFLKSNGASSAPTFAVPAGSGDVSKVGTPVNNQIGVWTGDGTIEGDAALTFDTATDTLATGIVTVTDDAYAAGWNGSTAVPTKNAVYDKIESLSSGISEELAIAYAITL